MDEFEQLLALTKASLACNSVARGFIDHCSEVPEYSTIGGRLYRHVAEMQAGDHLDYADQHARRADEVVNQWDAVSDALDYVQQAVGISRPPFIVAGKSYQTAHEAARYFAETVVEEHRRIGGHDNLELCDDLATRLTALREVPDFYGWIEGERHAAADLVPVSDGVRLCDDESLIKSLDALAVAVFWDHRDWTKRQIANHIGCHEKSLAPKRCPNLDLAIKAHTNVDFPHGEKAADGRLEAWVDAG